MKWITLAGMIFVLSGCCCTRSNEVIEYRQIAVAPVTRPIVYYNYYNSDYDDYDATVDVTTTMVDFY